MAHRAKKMNKQQIQFLNTMGDTYDTPEEWFYRKMYS